MAVIGYCSSWINGVCDEQGRSSLLQPTSMESFKRLAQRLGNLVLGIEGFRYLQDQEFDISSTRIAILHAEPISELPEVCITAQSPAHALAHFPGHAQHSVLVAADGKTIEEFLLQGLLNELILDIEPGLSTATKPLFPRLTKGIGLDLVGIRKVGAATVQHHYRVGQILS